MVAINGCCGLCGVQQQLLLCEKCTNEKVELTRNSCIDLENEIQTNRREINRVFSVSNELQAAGKAKEAAASGRRKSSTSSNGQHDQSEAVIPKSSLKIPFLFAGAGFETPSGAKGTLIASESSIKVLTQQLLKLQIVNAKIKVIRVERTIENLQGRNIKVAQRVGELKQLIQERRQQLDTTREHIFQSFQEKVQKADLDRKYLALQGNQVSKQVLKFQQQSFKNVIEIAFGGPRRPKRKFLLFGQPIINIEEFFVYNSKLEQLNTFIENVIILQTILKRIFRINLPYLKDLQKVLPDQKFFTMVKEKEMQMTGTSEEVSEPEEEEVEAVIKLGALKLPLSSKTINNQRRKSINVGSSSSPSIASPNSKSKPQTQKKEEMKSSIANIDQQPNAKESSKKIVIIPHKIITKPFTKLNQKEFIKFLQIIVKILTNFKILFFHTSPLNEVFNFTRILSHTCTLEESLSKQLLECSSTETDINSKTFSEPGSTIEDSLSHSRSNASLISKPSITNLYSKLFFQPEKSGISAISGSGGGIFGNVSEMGELRVPIREETEKKELGDEAKISLQHVYQIMAGGSKERMIHNRFQLKDWDVISKMI